MRDFDVARSRLQRAAEHIASAGVKWNTLPSEDLFEVNFSVDPCGNGTIRVAKKKPVPMEHSLLLGEALYHLRSALDACIYQASVYASGMNPPPDENKLEFPICSDRNEFPRLAKRRLFAIPQDLQDLVERVQPYNTPALPSHDMIRSVNRTLGILNDLARKDRHRTLHVVGSWVTKVHPRFGLPPSVKARILTRRTSGLLGDSTDIATFKLIRFRPGMTIHLKPGLTTEMALDEPPPACHENDTWPQRLTQIPSVVDFVIGEFENYF